MKESIHIKNLGPIKDVKIDDIRPLTVLIGPSGSGKSLVMKILVLFRYIYKMLNIRWYLKNANVNKSRFQLKIDNLLTPELRQYFNNKNLEIEYAVEIHGNVHGVAYRNGSIDRSTTDKTIPNEDLVFLKESWVSEMRGVIPQWAAHGNSSKKNSPKNNRTLDFYFQETFNDFQEATDEINLVRLGYLGVDLMVERRNGIKKFFFHPQDNSYRPMELRYGSSGLQTSSSIITLAKYFSSEFSFKDAIGRSIISYLYESDNLRKYNPELEPTDMARMVQIHIEEPELNLFPDAQCRLVEDLVRISFDDKSSDRNIKLMMATHSPYIVNYLNVLQHQNKAGRAHVAPEDLAVYRLHDGRLQTLKAVDENGKEFIDTQDLTEQMEAIMEEYDSLI